MTYIYDVMLNFNEYKYDFFEWDKSDIYYHIKKISMIRVNSKIYNDLLDYKVLFKDDFFINIFNKCEYYDKNNVKLLSYAFLVTDSYRSMAILLDSELRIIKYSSLLLDEEEEVLELSNRIPLVNLEYNILERNKALELTRNEEKILHYIKKDLEKAYQKKDLDKLKYLYYEYFQKENQDLNYIYQTLLKTLKKFSNKHNNLYNLIKLSYSNS